MAPRSSRRAQSSADEHNPHRHRQGNSQAHAIVGVRDERDAEAPACASPASRTEKALAYAHIGAVEDLLAVVGSDDDPSKPAPDPIPVILEATKRDLVSTATDAPILVVGVARFAR